tara:strand:+ start:61 stop:573 length:513 start_codon:yes stop_codon:yes gene_type:complete
MKPSKKKLIKRLHADSHPSYKGEIEKEFPKLFKKELPNGWYADRDQGQWLCFIEKGVMKYGFDQDGDWQINIELNYKLQEDDYKATKEQVRKSLIKEAKKRGFKEGVNADLTYCDHRVSDAKIIEENYRYNGRWLSLNNYIIFEKGKWAKVTETITKEEAEKELGKIIID